MLGTGELMGEWTQRGRWVGPKLMAEGRGWTGKWGAGEGL